VATFTIAKALVAKPDQGETSYVYDGEEKQFVSTDSGLYTADGNLQTEVGEYTVTISLIDKNNYAWADGTSDDLQYVYNIRSEDDMSLLAGILLGGLTAEVLAGLIAWGKRYRKNS
jgi:hypothetical protein